MHKVATAVHCAVTGTFRTAVLRTPVERARNWWSADMRADSSELFQYVVTYVHIDLYDTQTLSLVPHYRQAVPAQS